MATQEALLTKFVTWNRFYYNVNRRQGQNIKGYHYAVDTLKSLLLTMALVDKHIDVETAVDLARLELSFQTERWGTVEWAHDIEKFDLRCRLAAAALFIHWCSESTTVKQKAALAPV
ncbi:ATP synthase mitochondrial f1 complex assembly factor 2 [Plakobranchus ocellatus]|uniref:ATP synthase mitochondrial f1 complex assembly factor 2 n=1 Tax=Plakobranchus ocellatus TaxID=259542 RepID=A0AAV3ZVD6_9GAST|nr:ATP synthase mitochondrial f1 complex assembly factor 2 [Plakobranchus ocellatus]